LIHKTLLNFPICVKLGIRFLISSFFYLLVPISVKAPSKLSDNIITPPSIISDNFAGSQRV